MHLILREFNDTKKPLSKPLPASGRGLKVWLFRTKL